MSSESIECSICLEYIHENAVHTICNHLFHKECLSKHLHYDKRNRCPYCRTVISPLEKKPSIWMCDITGKLLEVVEVINTGFSSSGNEWIFVKIYENNGYENEYNRYLYHKYGRFIDD